MSRNRVIGYCDLDPTYSTLYKSRKSRNFDPLHVDPGDREGDYSGFYCSYSTGMDTGHGNLQRLGRVAIRVAFHMLMLEPEDFMWFTDKQDVTFQFMKKPQNEFWREFPDPDCDGGLGTMLSDRQLIDLLRQLPENLQDLQSQYDFEFQKW